MLKTLFTLITISFVSLSSSSQYFEGEIVFETENSESLQKKYPDVYPTKTTKSYSKKGFTKIIMNNNGTDSQITRNDTIYSIYENDGVKYCCYEYGEDITVEILENSNQQDELNKNLVRIKDTLEVIGEKCFKYISKSTLQTENGIETIINEYYVSISLTSKAEIGLKAMPYHIILKTVRKNNDDISTISAVKIEKKSLQESEFTLPIDIIFMDRIPGTNTFSPRNSTKKKKPKKKKKKRKIQAIDNNQKI